MAKNGGIPGAHMGDGTKSPVEASIIDRVVQGVKYIITGNPSKEWFGPGQPVAPQAQNMLGVPGRQFDFPVTHNIRRMPRDGEGGVTFANMRALADGYDLLRLAIETRKDQMSKMRWTFGLKPEVAKRKKQEERIARAKEETARLQATPAVAPEPTPSAGAAKPPVDPKLPAGADPAPAPGQPKPPKIPEMPKEDPRVEELREFFAFPDQEHDWETWLRALLEDMLVVDAATLYPRFTNDGGVYSLELVDGTTVKRIIDQSGRTPLPPDVAYQQVLKGMPAVDYNRDELIYKPRNVRTHKVYGLSPVEQVIMTVNIAIRRQISQLQYYTEGNIPEAMIGVPPEWNPDQIRQFQEYWDSLLEGNTAAKRHAKFVPGGLNYNATKEPDLKGEYDEWLARVICFAFSLSPQAFVKQMNRATADTANETAMAEGLMPVMNWVKNLVDYVVWKYFGYTDMEFRWEEEEEASPDIQMKVLTGYVAGKIMDADEARDKLGLDPFTPEQLEKMKPPPLPPGLPPPNPSGGPPKNPEDGGSGNPMGKYLGSALRKAKPRISRDRKKVQESISGLNTLMEGALSALKKRLAKELSEKLGKAITSSAGVKRLIKELTFAELQDLAPELAEILEDMAGDGGQAALAQVLADVTGDQLEQVHLKAVEYAKERSAALITQLEDATRDMLRGTLTESLEEGWSTDMLAAALEENYAFDSARAETIARTEIAYADVQGNLEGYKASGVVQGKQWIIAQDEYCDDCSELDGVIVGLEDNFPGDGGDGPPLHPNCRCDVLPVLFDET